MSFLKSVLNFPPVLFFTIQSTLKDSEYQRLLELRQNTKNEAEAAELAKFEALAKQEIPLKKRIPIVFAGNSAIPFYVENVSNSMNKNIELIGGDYVISPVLNITTIAISGAASDITGALSDLLFYLADAIYNDDSKTCAVSFFGARTAIANGYLVGISRNTQADTNREMINLVIARDFKHKKVWQYSEPAAEIEPPAEIVEILA